MLTLEINLVLDLNTMRSKQTVATIKAVIGVA